MQCSSMYCSGFEGESSRHGPRKTKYVPQHCRSAENLTDWNVCAILVVSHQLACMFLLPLRPEEADEMSGCKIVRFSDRERRALPVLFLRKKTASGSGRPRSLASQGPVSLSGKARRARGLSCRPHPGAGWL